MLPRQVEGLEGVFIIQVACGDCHTLVLEESGNVYGWGCYKDKVSKGSRTSKFLLVSFDLSRVELLAMACWLIASIIDR